ncbi:MAG: MoaD/ThiS family protein [Acidobacteriota bacterium]
MRIRLLYFALVAEIAGCQHEEMEVGDATSAGEVLLKVVDRYPRLGTPGFQPLLAVNREHASPEREVREGDEVAIFPPVAGG